MARQSGEDKQANEVQVSQSEASSAEPSDLVEPASKALRVLRRPSTCSSVARTAPPSATPAHSDLTFSSATIKLVGKVVSCRAHRPVGLRSPLRERVQ